jgi:uncharacterized protein (TIGR02246 family)
VRWHELSIAAIRGCRRPSPRAIGAVDAKHSAMRGSHARCGLRERGALRAPRGRRGHPRWDSFRVHLGLATRPALFSEDADFVDVFGSWFRNRTAIEGALTERRATVFRESSFIEKEVVIRGPTRDLAVVHSVLELTGARDRQARPLPPGLGVMTYVMDKVDGDWRIIAFQNSPLPPRHREQDSLGRQFTVGLVGRPCAARTDSPAMAPSSADSKCGSTCFRSIDRGIGSRVRTFHQVPAARPVCASG